MLYSAQGCMGERVMDVVTLVVFIGSMYFAGQIAQRRGRSLRNWLGIAAVIGPLALPLLFLFPNLRGKSADPA
jgi:hypothetical protein